MDRSTANHQTYNNIAYQVEEPEVTEITLEPVIPDPVPNHVHAKKEGFPKKDKEDIDDIENDVEIEPTEEKLLEYEINDTPPWYSCLMFGLQHFLGVFFNQVTYATIVADAMCVPGDDTARVQILNTIVFLSGICTIMIVLVGCRLPIVQVTPSVFIPAILSMASLPDWKCNLGSAPSSMAASVNRTGDVFNMSMLSSNNTPTDSSSSSFLPWSVKMRQVQGALITAACLEILVGGCGVLRLLLRFIGPVTAGVLIILVALPMASAGVRLSVQFWPLAAGTIFLAILCSQFLKRFRIPMPSYSRKKKCHMTDFPLFAVFPVLIPIVIMWIISSILTASGVTVGGVNDTRQAQTVLDTSPWITVPYPGQFGAPIFNGFFVLSLWPAIIVSIIDSIVDYYACAGVCRVPPPPTHAVTRGVFVEGIGVLFNGLCGSGVGVTSSGGSISLIAVSKVASRRVVIFAGIWLIFLGSFGKFGALFITIPKPVLGGAVLFNTGFFVSVGLQNLMSVKMTLPRNMFTVGFGLVIGIALPAWIKQNPKAIDTGNATGNQLLQLFFTSGMLMGGLISFIFDNIVPGTDDERGLTKWKKIMHEDDDTPTPPPGEIQKQLVTSASIYDLPLIMPLLKRWSWTKYIPFLPNEHHKKTPEEVTKM